MIQRQIQATDVQIDWLVYELYGLTVEEIKKVVGWGESGGSICLHLAIYPPSTTKVS